MSLPQDAWQDKRALPRFSAGPAARRFAVGTWNAYTEAKSVNKYQMQRVFILAVAGGIVAFRSAELTAKPGAGGGV